MSSDAIADYKVFFLNDIMNLVARFIVCAYMEDNEIFYVPLENNGRY